MQDVFTTIVQPGYPRQVAQFDAVAQAANIANTVLYAVPVGQGGMYRVSYQIVETQVATVSSTLPNTILSYTDKDSGVANNNYSLNFSNTGNALGIFGAPNSTGAVTAYGVISVKENTNILIGTANYASSGATPMQYAVHVRLEYLGP